ncbi:MAG: hypothetical protein MJ210_01195 [Alphaproteobacteria bacterium]|nr:hypothetical protein [Alphaproteobacteria bacterium]
MEPNKTFNSGQNEAGDVWYVDNYVLLKEYYDMTISRIAARCVRSGNIAIEEYKHYAYILDVLEEISETGEYILSHPNLYGYVDKKIPGGVNALKKNLNEFKSELEHNASPDMIKQDKNELNKMKEALGEMDKASDPTAGAGMSMDEVVNKLMAQNNIKPNFTSDQLRAQPVQPQPKPSQKPTQVAQQGHPQSQNPSGSASSQG